METQINECRLGLTLGKFLTERRKTLLGASGAYIGISVAIGLWAGMMGASAGGEMVLYIFMAVLMCSVAASMMFSDMKTKEGKTAMLMTPARPVDKFLTRFLVVVPGSIILAVLGFLAMAYSISLAHGITFGVWEGIRDPFLFSWDAVEWWVLISLFLLNESFFVFGAVAWPKLSFIKTLGILILLQNALTIVFMFLFRNGFFNVAQFDLIDDDAFSWTFVGGVILISAAIVWGAYIKFKNKTLV